VGADEVHAADVKEADEYARAYFPGVPAPELASPILLSAGEQRDVEFPVRKGGLSDVVGALELPDSAKYLDFLLLVEKESPGSWSFVASGKVRGGQFRLRNFSPGIYGLMAYTEGEPKWFADYTLEIGTKPVTHISIPVERPVDLSGSVRAAKDAGELPPGALAGIKVSLNPVKRIAVMGESDSADVKPDGMFKIAGVYAGWYFVSLHGLPKGWGIVEQRYKNGEAMNAGISIDGAMADNSLMFVVSPKLARVSVRVRDRDDKPVAGAKVVLLPEKMPALFSPWALRLSVSDENGGVSFEGLAPGRYKPVLLEGSEAKRDRDIELLRSKAAQVDPVEVRGGQGLVVSVAE